MEYSYLGTSFWELDTGFRCTLEVLEHFQPETVTK